MSNELQAELASELQQAKKDLRVFEIRLALARDLMANTLATGNVEFSAGVNDFETIYLISRNRNGADVEFAATENQPVKPGDVVKVQIKPVEPEISSN